MQAIGDRLREARMRRKIDITEVERVTKIRAKYLRALENEDFGMLPGPTFVKTFLRTYADYLGLDAQLLVEEYRARYEPRADAQPFVAPTGRREPRQRGPRRRPRAPSGPAGPGTALLVAVGVVLVIFAILGLTGGSNSTPSGPTTAARHRPPPRQRARPRRRVVPPATTVVLRVRPVGPTYVCVDHGRGTRPTFEGTISQPMEFRGRHLRINAGKSSVVLTVNHRRVTIPPTPLPVGYDFTPRGTSPVPAGLRPCI